MKAEEIAARCSLFEQGQCPIAEIVEHRDALLNLAQRREQAIVLGANMIQNFIDDMEKQHYYTCTETAVHYLESMRGVPQKMREALNREQEGGG